MKKDGLPWESLSKSDLGKLIDELLPVDQIRIAKALARAYRQIDRKGFVSPNTAKVIKKLLLKKIGKKLGKIQWNFIFKFIYGKKNPGPQMRGSRSVVDD